MAQIRQGGMDWLVGPDDGFPAAISWGAYPMAPWAGRIRGGGFMFDGQRWQLPPSLGPHAIHGVAFLRRWQVVERSAGSLHLALALGEARALAVWRARCWQTITLEPQRLSLRLQPARRRPRHAAPGAGLAPLVSANWTASSSIRAPITHATPRASPACRWPRRRGRRTIAHLRDTPVVIEREGCRARSCARTATTGCTTTRPRTRPASSRRAGRRMRSTCAPAKRWHRVKRSRPGSTWILVEQAGRKARAPSPGYAEMRDQPCLVG